MASVVYTEGFVQDVADKVGLPSKRAQIRAACELLESFPEMGSPLVRASLVERYGGSVRRLPASPFVIVYEYDPADDVVRVLGLDHGREIR